MQVFYKRTNGVTVDLLLLLGDGAEDLGTGGVVTKVFFGSLLELDNNGREHSLFDPSNIVVVKFADREKISFSVPNPRNCKGLDSLGYFPIFF